MTEVTPDKLTKVFLKIRAKREKLSAEFKEVDKALEVQQDAIKAALLDYCKENGVDSLKSEAGRVSRTLKTRYWTSDWESMYAFIKEHDVPEFFTKSLNQTNVRNFLEENPSIAPKGLNVDSEYQISIYKPTKK